MSQESGDFKLGAFVLAGAAILVGGVALLGSGVFAEKALIVETATDQSVQGLDVGAPVKFRGVPVGSVSKIELAVWRHPNLPIEEKARFGRYVLLEIALTPSLATTKDLAELRRNTKVLTDEGLRFRLASSGLTGPPYIEMLFLDPTRYPAPEPPWEPEGIFIPSAPSSTAELMRGAEDIVEKLRKVDVPKLVERLDRVLAGADKAMADLEVAEVRKRAVALIDEVRASNQRVREIVESQELRDAMAELPTISQRTRSAVERIDGIVNDDKMRATIDNLDVTTAGAAASAGELRQALRNVNVLLDTQRSDIESVVGNLRRVLDNLAVVTDDAKSNPSRLLLGKPPPRTEPGE